MAVTHQLLGCESKSAAISLQNDDAGYDATVSQVQTHRNVLCLRQLHRQLGQPQNPGKSRSREITSERTGEMSAQIRERVVQARKRQQQRFKEKPKITCNCADGQPRAEELLHAD